MTSDRPSAARSTPRFIGAVRSRRHLPSVLPIAVLSLVAACDLFGPSDPLLPDGRYRIALSEPTPTGPCLLNGENCEFPDWLMAEPVIEIRKGGGDVEIVGVDGGMVAEGRYREASPDHSPALWLVELYPGTDHDRRRWQVRGETSGTCSAVGSWWFDDYTCYDAYGDPYACGKKFTSVTLICGITRLDG